MIRETPSTYNVPLLVRISAMLSLSERAVDLLTHTLLPDFKAASSVHSLDHVAFTVWRVDTFSSSFSIVKSSLITICLPLSLHLSIMVVIWWCRLISLSLSTHTHCFTPFWRGAAVFERLHVSPFKRKTRVRFPELTPTNHWYFHCIHTPLSPASSGWGRKMSVLCIGSVLRARNKTKVALAEGHVSPNPMFCLSFLSSMHETCVSIMLWIAFIVLKGRKTPILPPPPLVWCIWLYTSF